MSPAGPQAGVRGIAQRLFGVARARNSGKPGLCCALGRDPVFSMAHCTPSRRRPPLLAACLIALASAAACKEEAPPQRQMPPPQVTVVTLKTQPVTLTRELPGRTTPFMIAEVRPQVNGIVKKRLFTEGSVVKAGDALYQIDDATYRADYATAQAAVSRAKVTLESTRLRAERAKELMRSNLVSTQEEENAVAAFRQAEADLKAAEAALQRSAVVLGYSRITAPIGGRVGKSTVTQGALVTANQPQPLATVQTLDPIYVDLTQSSGELLQLRREVERGTLQRDASLPVTILLEDGTRYSHEGRLAFADVTVDPGTGSFALRIQVPNPDNILLPGMYVRAVVGVGVRQDGVLVPQPGISRDPKGNATAMVVGKDGKVEARVVQASRTVGDQWLVDAGLAPGDKVIVEGLQKIRPGVPVQATEAPPSPTPATSGSGVAPGAAPPSAAAPASAKAP